MSDKKKIKKKFSLFDDVSISGGVTILFLFISLVFLHSFEGFPISLTLAALMAVGLSFFWIPAIVAVISILVFWRYKAIPISEKFWLIFINLALFGFFALVASVLFFFTPLGIVDNLI